MSSYNMCWLKILNYDFIIHENDSHFQNWSSKLSKYEGYTQN